MWSNKAVNIFSWKIIDHKNKSKLDSSKHYFISKKKTKSYWSNQRSRLTIYALATQTFCTLLTLFSILSLVIFKASPFYILYQIFFLHTLNLQFYIATHLLYPILKSIPSFNIHLLSQAASGFMPKAFFLTIHLTCYVS